jgi:hypothetical protein
MKAFSLISAFALAATLVAVQDPAAKSDLTRKFKEGEVHRYKLVLTMEQSDTSVIAGTLEMKIVKTPDGKPAESEIKMTNFKSTRDGTEDPGFDVPSTPFKIKYDKFGMPGEFAVQDSQVVITALGVCSYLPAKSVAVNEPFAIDWTSPDKSGTVKGNGQVTSIKNDGDKKIAVVKSKIEAQPDGAGTPAVLEVESEFDLASGALIKSTAKGEIGDGKVTITVSEVKETK